MSGTGLGPTGNGGGRGFLLHSSLMVRPDGKEIAGLAGQVIRYRRRVKRESGGAKRLRRKGASSVGTAPFLANPTRNRWNDAWWGSLRSTHPTT